MTDITRLTAEKLLAADSAANETAESRKAARAERKQEEILNGEAEPLAIEMASVPHSVLEEESDSRYADESPQERELLKSEAASTRRKKSQIDMANMLAIPEAHTADMYRAELKSLPLALRRASSEKEKNHLTARGLWLSKKINLPKAVEKIAKDERVSRRTIQRRAVEARREMANIVQMASKLNVPSEHVFDVMEGLPPELQSKVAHELERRALIWQIEAERYPPRALRLNRGILNALDALGRNNATTWDALGRMTPEEQNAEIARMRRDRLAAERRADEIARLRDMARAPMLTPACDSLGAAFAAATCADRERFLEIHGLRRATTIPGEDVGIAFSAVEGE